MASVLRKAGSAADSFAALPSPILFLCFFAAVVLMHATLLRLPYFWDEGGYYIPAAFDFYKHGQLIPEFTNAHPPLPNILIGLTWKLFGFHILVTRLLACATAAAALLAVLRLAQTFLAPPAALTVCMLTAVYSIWYAQSSLAHADLFAALFTLWGFVVFFHTELAAEPVHARNLPVEATASRSTLLKLAGLFTLSVLAKETAILQPAVLAAIEVLRWIRSPQASTTRASAGKRALALSVPALPLAGWFAYHRLRTGFTFGNPEFLRYNATANLTAEHLFSALRYRFVHLFWQREMWLPLLLAVGCLVLRRERTKPLPFGLPASALTVMGALVLGNWLAFSILGGALLTRYLLPIYPLLLLVCVAVWKERTSLWPLLVAGTAVVFVSSWWLNPPTFFAPEDNLTYRDMVITHQQAIRFVEARYPQATVLTAWPIAADLVRPELGYISRPLRVASVDNFSLPQIQRAAQEPQAFDTAIVFSTHFVPPSLQTHLDEHPDSPRARIYNATRDLSPTEIASLLGGRIVWQNNLRGEWAAVVRFARNYQARAIPEAFSYRTGNELKEGQESAGLSGSAPAL